MGKFKFYTQFSFILLSSFYNDRENLENYIYFYVF